MRKALCLLLLLLGFAEIESQAAKAVLAWVAPTYNTNGTALTNLAGFVIQYRPKGTTVWLVRKINNPGASVYTLWNLAPGTWQFRMKAYNNVGIRSAPTQIVEAKL